MVQPKHVPSSNAQSSLTNTPDSLRGFPAALVSCDMQPLRRNISG